MATAQSAILINCPVLLNTEWRHEFVKAYVRALTKHRADRLLDNPALYAVPDAIDNQLRDMITAYRDELEMLEAVARLKERGN